MGRMLLLERASGGQTEGYALIRKADVRVNIKGAEYMDLVLADRGGRSRPSSGIIARRSTGNIPPGT